MTLEDVQRLQSVPGILSVMARVNGVMDVRTAAASVHAYVTGVDDRFVGIYRVPLVRGRGFLKEEVDKKQAVCLLTAETAEKLFPLAEPIGKSVDMQGTIGLSV